MAEELADLYLKMRADMTGYDRPLRQSEGTADHFENHASGVFANVAKMAIGLGSVVGGLDLFKNVLEAGRTAREATAQTAAVLASTGGVANQTATGIEELSRNLSNLDGVNRDVVQGNANLLLTFTNVRNEVGNGNDIFNQATAAVLDMSAALGEDGKSASIQLGKALNDPINGLTALRRVGVAFTDQQKEQIKTLVNSGQTMAAQKIILSELTKEFGGSAAATADPLQRLGVIFHNLEEQLGEALLPVLDSVSSWLSSALPTAIDVASTAFGAVQQAVSDFVSGFTVGTDDLGSAQSIWAQWGAVAYTAWLRVQLIATETWAKVRPILTAIVGYVQDHWQPVWQRFLDVGTRIVNFIRSNLSASLAGLGAAVLAGAVGFQVLAGAAEEAAVAEGAALAPILAIGLAVGVLAGGLVYAYQRFDGFRTVVDSVVSWFSGTAWPLLQRVFVAIEQQVEHLVSWWTEHWRSIHDAVRNVLVAIAAQVAIAVAAVLFIWDHFGEQILAVVTYAWDSVQNVVQTAVRIIGDIIAFWVDLLSGNWGKAWDDVKDILAAAWDFIKTGVSDGVKAILVFFTTLPANIVWALGDIGGKLKDVGIAAMNGLWDGIKAVFGNVVDWFTKLPGRIKDAIGDLSSLLLDIGHDLAKGFLDGIKSAFSDIAGVVTGANNTGVPSDNPLFRDTAPPAPPPSIPGVNPPGSPSDAPSLNRPGAQARFGAGDTYNQTFHVYAPDPVQTVRKVAALRYR